MLTPTELASFIIAHEEGVNIFPEVDENKTIAKVNDLLGNYDRLKRMSLYDGHLTANYRYSLEKKTQSTSDGGVGKVIERRERGREIINEIDNAIELVEPEYRQILKAKYFSKRLDFDIYSSLSISSSGYYQKLRKAKLQFAEAYKAGELLCFV
ncbi:DUF1492 domain-containing protein [Aerococcus sp. JJEM-2022a]|uniref:DUF1492 domain-containing protein n=1 Tax=Aerococcus loyolae TaxID=2976809 RepID=A0ABT4C2L5_9LACT|nr:ArpU family phage packaging/lysis transcriptional regulator [Aerococcus loyolae]MCY3025893.1 DUF1492 domain-containing protein [Aerococcus loyolae]MCY3029649.1 DUF1492 domain-containing protein [Aerococcus loyolae]